MKFYSGDIVQLIKINPHDFREGLVKNREYKFLKRHGNSKAWLQGRWQPEKNVIALRGFIADYDNLMLVKRPLLNKIKHIFRKGKS